MSFWFFEKTEFFAILAILKINSGSNREALWQKMQQADHIYDLEERKLFEMNHNIQNLVESLEEKRKDND